MERYEESMVRLDRGLDRGLNRTPRQARRSRLLLWTSGLALLLTSGPPPAQGRGVGLTKQQLQRRLRKQVRKPLARKGTFAVYVKVLGGPVLFARRGRRRLHPASCVKLVTSSVALRLMGREHRFETTLRGRIEKNRMTTPLVLQGRGDPSLTRNDLGKLAKALAAKGVKQIPSLQVDDHYFDGRHWPPGFRKPSSSAYMTPTGAVSLDGNTVEVVVEPTEPGKRAKVTLLPPSGYLELKRGIRTRNRRKNRVYVFAVRHGKKLKVVVNGAIRPGSATVRRWVRVLHPTRYAGESFKRMLEDEGITVGPVKRGRAGDAPVILRHRSEPLVQLVKTMNGESNNFYAEQLLKALGAKKLGPPGSTRKGIRASQGLLRRSGIRRGRYRMSNGSGLFGRTRFSPRQLVRLLQRLKTLPWLYRAIYDSLAVGGIRGTLSKRFRGSVAAGRVHAKTGTLDGVSCLAGFVDGRRGRPPLLFAILHNGFQGPHYRVRRIQDAMVEAMARYQLRP